MSHMSVVNHVCCVIKDSFPFAISDYTVPVDITVRCLLSDHKFTVFVPSSFLKRP